MIDHVTLRVSNLSKSKTFYKETFHPLSYQVAFGEENKFWAFDTGDGVLFEIMQHTGNIATPCHIAFRVKSHKEVQEFYEAAINAGGKCNGPPGPRPEYTENYYAAFILDPDGYNIEAVCDIQNS